METMVLRDICDTLKGIQKELEEIRKTMQEPTKLSITNLDQFAENFKEEYEV